MITQVYFFRLVFVCHNQGNIDMIKYTSCYSGAKTRHLYCSMEKLHLRQSPDKAMEN